MEIIILVLCLLLVKGHSLEGAAALTFDSRIIHGSSEEAKDHFASKSLSNDLTRQMRLDSQYETLYPSEGSHTVYFGSEFFWFHYVWIDIGTPNISFLVALDTGSDLLWLPCDCKECAPLSAGHYKVLDRDLNKYSPSLSSTSKRLPCGHKLCNISSISICKSPKEPCAYMTQYATANTSSSGFLIEEKLHLTYDGRHTAQGSVQASIILGCGRKQTGGYLNGVAPDGVLGLGPRSISVPSLLAKAGLIRNSFSICLNYTDSGRILFGDQGQATQQSTSFLPIYGEFDAYVVGVESFCIGSFCPKQSGFKALIDTGSSFTYLPFEVYTKVVSEFEKQVNSTRMTLTSWPYCYNVSSKEFTNIPRMKLTFSESQTFLIDNPLVTTSLNQDYIFFCLAVRSSYNEYGTIGVNFLIGHRMVFDMENLRLGWSTSNCQYSAPTGGSQPSTPRLTYLLCLLSLIWHLLCR